MSEQPRDKSVPMDFWKLAPESEDNPPRSEQPRKENAVVRQEWTPEYVAGLIGLANIELPAHTLKRIADAHNATLAAQERAWRNEVNGLLDSLAAERKKVKGLASWLRASLDCKQHVWEPDQRAAAEETIALAKMEEAK